MHNKDFLSKIETINFELDPKVDPTFYNMKDNAGSFDGPTQDWVTSHHDKFFKYLRKKNIVVTAGANIGLYTRVYSYYFDTVYAFEPDVANFHCLCLNNPYDNVIKMQAGLGENNTFGGVVSYTNTNTGMAKLKTGQGFVPVIAVDSLKLPTLDLLQLDVEGAEYQVLLGAIQTINKFRPVIAAERGEGPEIRKLLDNNGYRLVDKSVADSIWIPKE